MKNSKTYFARGSLLVCMLSLLALPVHAKQKSKVVKKSSVTVSGERPGSLTASLPGGKLGVAIYSIDDGKQVFGHNDTMQLNPASCMKILTAVAALKTLGADFRYKTTYSTDSLSGAAARNLYVAGGGDPFLVQERLLELGKNLYEVGLREVKGDIIVDNSYFDGMEVDGKLGDSAEPYTAKVSALAINFNSFKVVSNGVGGSASVQIDPPLDYFTLNSTARPGRGGFYINRAMQNGKEVVTVKGHYSGVNEQYATVSDPVGYAGYAIKWALESAGIQVKGEVHAGTTPQSATLLFVDESKPLPEILGSMNKFSNNFIAEMTLKTIGAEMSGRPGSTTKGAMVLRKYLASIGVNETEYDIVNGSGLSRFNRISAKALMSILVDAAKTDSVREKFIETLPIAGVDGTLKSRMKTPEFRGNVHAKTGTLNGASSLAGYMKTRHGHHIAFAILMNGALTGGGGYHNVQENVLKAVYDLY